MLLAALTPPETETAVWKVDPTLSRVTFEVRHLGFVSVAGEFRDYDVDARFNPGDLGTLSVDASIKVSSIDTGDPTRDSYVRKQFFDSDRYPEMTFRSGTVEWVEGNRASLVGDLTIRSAGLEVVFHVKEMASACIEGENHVAMEVSTTLEKRDLPKSLVKGIGSILPFAVKISLDLDLVQTS
ncbi:MAG: YceI family protein [Rhodothermales bacterium]